VSAVIEQLGLDQTFFFQFVIFWVVFLLLARIFFRPFLGLFEARHKRTVEDREAAEKLLAQAEARFEEYKKRLVDARLEAKREYDAEIAQAKKEEAALLHAARDEAKKITQEAAEAIGKQREQLKKSLEGEVDQLARTISERLVSRKV
jgi:F-type H+-transporting ATPase subunit b